MLKLFGYLSGGVVIACALKASAAVSVANSSFESPSVANFEYNPTLAEQGGTGWSWIGTGLSGVAHNGGFTAGLQNSPDGVQAGIVQITGGITQVLSGFGNGLYQISFYAEGRAGFGDGANPMNVTLDGVPLTFGLLGTTVTPPVGSTFVLYQSDPTLVLAGSHELDFIGTNAGSPTADRTSFIDQVSVNAVPEPATVSCVIATGVLGLSWRRRR